MPAPLYELYQEWLDTAHGDIRVMFVSPTIDENTQEFAYLVRIVSEGNTMYENFPESQLSILLNTKEQVIF